jgi:hypothetical protein
MVGTDLATNTNKDVPTLVELIEAAGADAQLGTPMNEPSYTAIHAAAVALETEYAVARAELSTKAVEYLQVFKQLEALQDLYDLESNEADAYAKKMHASDGAVQVLYEYLLSLGNPLPETTDEIKAAIGEAMARVQNKGSRGAGTVGVKIGPDGKLTTKITEESAPLIELES